MGSEMCIRDRLKVQEAPSGRRGVALILLRPQAFPICAMAPQFTLAEVDFMQQQAAAGHKPPEVLRRMAQRRARRGLAPPDATSVRRVLKGNTHARAKTETRGRKPSLSPGKLSDVECLDEAAAVNPVTGQPSDAEASMVRRRLKVYPFRTRIPKPEPQVPYCGHCFAELVCQYGTPLVHQAA